MSTTDWRLTDLTQIRGLVHERNALAHDYVTLQHAAQALHDTVNRYLAGQADPNALRHAQAQLASLMEGSHDLDAVLPPVDGMAHHLITMVGDTTPPQNIVCPNCGERNNFRLLWLGDLSQAFTQTDDGERNDYDSHDNEGDFLNLEIQIACESCDTIVMERPVTITVDPWQYGHTHDDNGPTRIPGVQRIIAATEALGLYDNTP